MKYIHSKDWRDMGGAMRGPYSHDGEQVTLDDALPIGGGFFAETDPVAIAVIEKRKRQKGYSG